jgi:alkylation response protein AidB-like acyl-CoA dehydrogenase
MMPALDYEFAPTIDRDEMLADPGIARKIMRQVLDWLDTYAAARPEAEQEELARRAGIRSGLYAAEYPAGYGGRSLPERVMADLREEAGASGLRFSDRILCSDDGPSMLLMDATPEQQDTWLRPLIDGRLIRCLAMTEEWGGSDLSGLRTTATPTANGWRLSGRKFLVSNAAEADVAIVLANVVDGRATGLTFFIFSTDAPGWKVGRRLPGMDPLLNQYEVELDSIELTDSAIVGGPGKVGGATGMALERMAYGRVAFAARAVGLSRWALSVAQKYADERMIGGERLSEKQYIREFIVGSYVRIEAARNLVRQAATALDAGQLAIREAALAKLYATESACKVIDDAMQVLGGRGWLSAYGLEQAYREARVFRLVDGSTEVLKETIFHLMPGTDGHRIRS